MRRTALLSCLLVVLFATAASAATVKVKQNRTPMRAEPRVTSATVAYYQNGDLLELVDAADGWYKVRDPETNRQGYILTTLAELLPGPPADQPAPGQAPPRGVVGRPAVSPRQPSVQAGDRPTAGVGRSAGPGKPAATPANHWTDVGFIAVDGVYQGGGSAFSDTFSFARYLEQATVTTDYPKKDGPAFNLGGAFRVWRNLALGLAVSGVSRSTSGHVAGSVPHPFFFNAGRPIEGTAALKHAETAVHVQAVYVVPVGRRVLVGFSGGPSFFSVKRSIVESVQYSESYPYDTAVLLPVTTTDATSSVVGVNGGVDVGYYFTRAVGLGVTARYAGANVSLPSHGASVSVRAGGFQAGIGLRVRIPKPPPKQKPSPPPPAKPVKK